MKRSFAFTACILSSVLLYAEKTPYSPIRLGGPEVAKVGWKTQSLRAADMNNDGRQDLLLINNEDAKIDILLQQDEGGQAKPLSRKLKTNRWEPVLDDALFHKEHVVTGLSMYSLAVGDLNDDGLNDLIYTSKEDPLTVRYQLESGGFRDAEVYQNFEAVSWTSSLTVRDVNGDGIDDIVVLGKEKLLVFISKSGQEVLGLPQVMRIIDDVAYGIDLVDVNNDGRLDLMFLLGNARQPLRLRFQDEDGNFGHELAFDLEVGLDVVQVLGSEGAGLAFVYIQKNSGFLESFTIDRVDGTDAKNRLIPNIYTTGTTSVNPAVYAVADFDGDGLEDIAVGDATESVVRFFPGESGDSFGAGIDYPSIASISAMYPLKSRKGKSTALAVFSEREAFIGLSRYEDKRFRFPEPLEIDGEVKAMHVDDVDGNGSDDLIVVLKDGKLYSIASYSIAKDGSLKELESIELTDTVRAPDSIWLQDLDHDGHKDLILLARREAARIFRRVEEGGYEEVAVISSIRKSLLYDLHLKNLASGDINDDGNDELIIMGEGYARAIRLGEDGKFEIVDQCNARSREDDVMMPMIIDIDDDGNKEIVFYHISEGDFQILEKNEDGVYRYERSMEIGEIDPTGSVVLKTKKGGDRLMVFGKQRFWSLGLQENISNGWALNPLSSYETDFEDVAYDLFCVGDVNGDGEREIILVDGQKHLLEVLKRTEMNDWKSLLHFTVFDENSYYRGRKGGSTEPREVITADFTDDGLQDVAVLVHDRVIVYPQLK